MLFRYNVELHLTYNRMALYDRTPDSEFRVELEKPFVWKINQTVQTKEENGEPKTFSDTYKIELSSVWKENIEKLSMLLSKFQIFEFAFWDIENSLFN